MWLCVCKAYHQTRMFVYMVMRRKAYHWTSVRRIPFWQCGYACARRTIKHACLFTWLCNARRTIKHACLFILSYAYAIVATGRTPIKQVLFVFSCVRNLKSRRQPYLNALGISTLLSASLATAASCTIYGSPCCRYCRAAWNVLHCGAHSSNKPNRFQLNISGYVFASWIGRGLWGRILTCSSIRAASLLFTTATPESLTSTTRRMWGRAETQRMFRLLREWDEFYPLGEVLLYLAEGNPPLVLSVLF